MRLKFGSSSKNNAVGIDFLRIRLFSSMNTHFSNLKIRCYFISQYDIPQQIVYSTQVMVENGSSEGMFGAVWIVRTSVTTSTSE